MTATSDLAATAADDSAAVGIQEGDVITETRALSIDADWLRTDVEMLHEDVKSLHDRTRSLDLDDRAYDKATNSDVPRLLEELAVSRGMSWSDIALATGVSVSAVRKWRKGGTATAESRGNLGKVAALLDVLEEKAVPDPAQWMEMRLPLPSGYFIRPIDLYVDGHAEALIELAERRQEAEQVLDEATPGWRDARTDFEVVVDSDGQRTIRAKGK